VSRRRKMMASRAETGLPYGGRLPDRPLHSREGEADVYPDLVAFPFPN
jgi:hypothetical protein